MTWSAPTGITSSEDPHALSCPSASFCAAIDLGSNVITSTDPTGGGSAWTPVHIDSQPAVLDVSCASSSFCAATGESPEGHGEVWTSTDPTGDLSAWHAAAIDPGNRVTDIDCPAASLCVAVDFQGNELTSTNPTGGAATWSAPQAVAARVNGTLVSLNHVDCPTVSFCAASNGYDYISYEEPSSGNVVVSANPTGGSSAWIVSPSISNGLFGLSCPLSGLCLVRHFVASVRSIRVEKFS